jgi:predicted MFS family arabinose efflux permease
MSNDSQLILRPGPALIFNTVLTIPCVGWLSVAMSYNSFAAARILAGVAASVAQTVPAMVIADMFKKSERGGKWESFACCDRISTFCR